MKLKESGNAAEVRDIALVFAELNARRLYSFSADPEPLRILEQKARSLGGQWASTTLEMATEIRDSGWTGSH
jgi:hypothetical protein